jgi:hypothetical protein
MVLILSLERSYRRQEMPRFYKLQRKPDFKQKHYAHQEFSYDRTFSSDIRNRFTSGERADGEFDD